MNEKAPQLLGEAVRELAKAIEIMGGLDLYRLMPSGDVHLVFDAIDEEPDVFLSSCIIFLTLAALAAFVLK